MVSLPITITFLCVPAPTNCAPTVSAYENPEHAADRSKPHAFFAPIRHCTRQAVAGKNMSGVTLATIIISISEGSVFVCASNAFAASVAKCDEAMPFSTMCRSRIPVRVRIHSSLVSTIFSKSALVITLGGTYPATPVIFAAIRWDIGLLGVLSMKRVSKNSMRCQAEKVAAPQHSHFQLSGYEFPRTISHRQLTVA